MIYTNARMFERITVSVFKGNARSIIVSEVGGFLVDVAGFR